jgi:hypothetical protein
MSGEPEIGQWTVRHFSQANPAGPGQDDVPGLLRRVADSIEGLGAVEVQDITYSGEDDRPTMTVYFHEQDAAL